MLEILVCIYYLGRHFLPRLLGFFCLPLAGELAFKNGQSLIVYFWPISKTVESYISLVPRAGEAPKMDSLDSIQVEHLWVFALCLSWA